MLILQFQDDPLFVISVIFTAVFSITLHELAHGWTAIRFGDRTPIELERMTLNPVVHMGPFAIALLLTTGMAFGSMPINRSRLRGRHADAVVSVAGPAMNLLLAIIALTGLGIWMRMTGVWGDLPADARFQANTQQFLWLFGLTNVALVILNLLPIPPLDGSHIVASFHGGYRRLVSQFANPAIFILGLLVLLVMFRAVDLGIFDLARSGCLPYIELLSGLDLYVRDY